MESQTKKEHTLQKSGYFTENCPNLLKKFVVEEVFFRCKAQNELPLGSDFVDNLCIGDYFSITLYEHHADFNSFPDA